MRSVFPMKTYEYLAAGRPVVATPLQTLADVADVAWLPQPSSSHSAFRRLSKRQPQAQSCSLATAQPHSWESRMDEIADALRLPKPATASRGVD